MGFEEHGAYGVAVSLLMVITTLLAALIARQWGYPLIVVVMVNRAFLLIDLAFFGANSVKIAEGDWPPLAITCVICLLMLTWRRGEQLVETARNDLCQTPAQLQPAIQQRALARRAGCGAFLTLSGDGVPLALSRLHRLTGGLPERILIVSMGTEEIPTVAEADHVEVRDIAPNVRRVILRHGFTETINAPRSLEQAATMNRLSAAQLVNLVYYTSSEPVIAIHAIPDMAVWREKLFSMMQRNAERPAAFHCIPPAGAIDVGTEIAIWPALRALHLLQNPALARTRERPLTIAALACGHRRAQGRGRRRACVKLPKILPPPSH